MRKTSYLIALLLLFISACYNSANKTCENNGILSQTEDYNEILGEPVNSDIIIKSPTKLLIIGNYLLIAQFRQDSLIQVVDLRMKEEPYMIAPKGAGPHDFYDIKNLVFLSNDSLLGIYDVNFRKYAYYYVKGDKLVLDATTFDRSDYLNPKEFNCNPTPFGDYFVMSMCQDADVLALCDKELNVINYFGRYPGAYPGENDINPAHFADFSFSDSDLFKLSHYQHIITNPQQDRVAVAGMWSDWLAFFKQEADTMKQTASFFSYDSFTIVSDDPFNSGSSGRVLGPKHSTKTIASYQDLYATERHLYALYYGFPELDKDNPENTGYILQFDWDGNYQKAYHLKEVINRFAVDEERNCIYATYTPKGEDPVLLKYDLGTK